jgi:hypothetical protein
MNKKSRKIGRDAGTGKFTGRYRRGLGGVLI